MVRRSVDSWVTGAQLVGQGAGRSRQGPIVALGQRNRPPNAGRGEGDGHHIGIEGQARMGGGASRRGPAGPAGLGGQGDGGHHGGAEPGRHEGEDAVHLAALAHEVRFGTGRTAGGEGHRPQVVALAEHHEREAVEVAHLHPVAPRPAGDRERRRGRAGRRRAGWCATRGSVTGSTTRARSTSPLASWGTSWRDPASTTSSSIPGWLAWNSTRAGSEDPGDQAGRGADREPPTGHAAAAPVPLRRWPPRRPGPGA